jgi:hypothetical protein
MTQTNKQNKTILQGTSNIVDCKQKQIQNLNLKLISQIYIVWETKRNHELFIKDIRTKYNIS